MEGPAAIAAAIGGLIVLVIFTILMLRGEARRGGKTKEEVAALKKTAAARTRFENARAASRALSRIERRKRMLQRLGVEEPTAPVRIPKRRRTPRS